MGTRTKFSGESESVPGQRLQTTKAARHRPNYVKSGHTIRCSGRNDKHVRI